MFGNIKRMCNTMWYDLDYAEIKKMFDYRIENRKDLTGESIQCGWLPNFNENILEEAERLNVILPVMQWQTEHNDVTEEIKGELGWYYNAFKNDNFEEKIDEEERELVKKIFFECYDKAFKK